MLFRHIMPRAGLSIVIALMVAGSAFAQEEAEAAEGASAAGLTGLFLLAGIGILILTGFIIWSQNRANDT